MVDSPRSRTPASRRRWSVNVVLILGFVASGLSPIFLSRTYLGHSGTTDHAIASVLVLGVVLIHLWQRRRTIRRLTTRLLARSMPVRDRSHLAQSDLLLWILTVNATLSGVTDYVVGHPTMLAVPGPFIIQKWHAMSALVLLIYVVTHVIRRRRRLRWSQIT